MEYKEIADPRNKEELKKKYGKSIVPTFIVKGKILTGFEQNKSALAKFFNI